MSDFLKGLWTSLFKHVKSESSKFNVNFVDVGKAARTAGIVGLVAALGSMITSADHLDYGGSETLIVAGLGWLVDFVHRWRKDNTDNV